MHYYLYNEKGQLLLSITSLSYFYFKYYTIASRLPHKLIITTCSDYYLTNCLSPWLLPPILTTTEYSDHYLINISNIQLPNKLTITSHVDYYLFGVWSMLPSFYLRTFSVFSSRHRLYNLGSISNLHQHTTNQQFTNWSVGYITISNINVSIDMDEDNGYSRVINRMGR